MADDDQGLLSKIGSGLGQVLPYAIPIGLGAAMGASGGKRGATAVGAGLAGAAAGGAEAAGVNQEAAYRQALEQSRLRHEQAQEQYWDRALNIRQTTEEDRTKTAQGALEDRQKRTKAYEDAVTNRTLAVREADNYRKQLLALQQQRIGLTGKALEQNQQKMDTANAALRLAINKAGEEHAKVLAGEHYWISGDEENRFTESAKDDFVEKITKELGVDVTPKGAEPAAPTPKKLEAKPATTAATGPKVLDKMPSDARPDPTHPGYYYSPLKKKFYKETP